MSITEKQCKYVNVECCQSDITHEHMIFIQTYNFEDERYESLTNGK